MPQSYSETDFEGLQEDTFIKEVVYLEEVDSTNNYAKHLEGPAPTLVLCGNQT